MKSVVPYPPRELFLYDDKVQDMMKEQHITYFFERIEYVPFQGSLFYIQGADQPRKGFPTPDAIWAINQIKVVVTEAMKLTFTAPMITGLLLTRNKLKFIEKVIRSFNFVGNRVMRSYLYKEIFLTRAAYSFNNVVMVFMTSLGIKQEYASDFAYLFAHIVEYDDAYRFRLQDIVSGTTVEALKNNPRKELRRLADIFKAREHNDEYVIPKFERLIKVLLLLLIVPKVKKAFIASLIYIDGIKYDESDRYWVSVRGDYDFFGETYEERFAKLINVPQQHIVNHE